VIRHSSQFREVAGQLMAAEALGNTPAETGNPTLFRAIDTLRPHLSMLMGHGGFQALLARALMLAKAEVPWLTSLRVVAAGELEGLTANRPILDDATFREGELVFLAHLLGLLVAFIGAALTLRLINQLWPQLSFKDADFGKMANCGEAK
jgi:hypothetical protein